MLARRDTWIEASRVRRFSPLQSLEDQSQAWGRCCHFCTGREGLAPSWNTELQSLALCGLSEDSVLFRPTGHTGRKVTQKARERFLHSAPLNPSHYGLRLRQPEGHLHSLIQLDSCR